jgi:flagellar basal body-associated protein FliL
MRNIRKNMETKKLLVSFVMLVSVLFMASIVSAATPLVTGSVNVEVDGIDWDNSPAIVVGDTLNVKVEFESAVNASDITVEVEVEGERRSVDAQTSLFDVEEGHRYVKTLRLEVPFDLKDELSGFADLSVEISGSGFKTTDFRELRVQRESFKVDIKSIGVPQTVKAGDTFPVDIVLKNIGYNDLDDVYVTAKISALDIEKSVFFGDIVALECDDTAGPIDNYGVEIDRKCNEDDEDTTSGRIFLQLPFDTNPGVYALELEIESEDMVSSKTVQVVIENAFSEGHFIVSGDQLLIVNPTNQLVVYRLVPQSTAVVSVSLSESVVAVSAGSSRTVTVDATSNVLGTQTYAVNVFSADGTLVDTVSFSKNFEGRDATSSIVVLTIVLAIIFIVLLVVLIVLLGKKPKKAEEFGESYY